MPPPFAAFELITKLVGNVEADVIEETRAAEQRVLADLSSRGHGPSTLWVHQVTEAMQRLIESREKKVIETAAKALKARPPAYLDEAMPIQIANFLMEDLGRYYNHGAQRITRVVGLVKYVDSLPPNLSDHEERLRRRITGEIEIILAEIKNSSAVDGAVPIVTKNRAHVFIVHGRNEEYRKTVCASIVSFGLVPIVLHEQPNKGRTIIEKFEDHADVGFAVVILSGDDVARLRADEAAPLKPRPRQNVVLEFGFFLGRLGRKNVCALYEAGVELPSDYDGVLWVPLDVAGAWKEQLRQEIVAAGFLRSTNQETDNGFS